jgi:hypothetical protein
VAESVPNLSDSAIYQTECVLIVLLFGAYTLYLLLRGLRHARPDLRIGKAVAVAFGLRFLAAAGLGQLSISQQLRGGDELTFLARARDVATLPIGSPASMKKLTGELHTFLFSLHDRVFHPAPPELMLRVEMITFSVIGLALLAAAVYELAGARPAFIAAWILALEPTNVFFSSLLHKEPLMYMAEGMVAFGGAVLWKRGRLLALVPMVLGCLIATATRPYAGWFLAAAAAAVVLHASLTRRRGLQSLVLAAVVVALAALFFPVVWNRSSKENLKQLQLSQNANAADTQANLSLERIDYSTREKIIINMPKRVYDVITRPYLWQAQNTSQRLGILGTLVVLTCLVLLVGAVLQNRSTVMQRAGPLVYPAVLMLMAYALSAGNAGTAFRYRTHIVALALALIVVVRQGRREEQAAREEAEASMWKKLDTAPTLAS